MSHGKLSTHLGKIVFFPLDSIETRVLKENCLSQPAVVTAKCKSICLRPGAWLVGWGEGRSSVDCLSRLRAFGWIEKWELLQAMQNSQQVRKMSLRSAFLGRALV
jgi:hypothetical protein